MFWTNNSNEPYARIYTITGTIDKYHYANNPMPISEIKSVILLIIQKGNRIQTIHKNRRNPGGTQCRHIISAEY